MTRGRLTRAERHRPFRTGVVAAALLLVAGGCASSRNAYPERAPELSSRLYLDSTQVRPGTPIKGTLVIANSTKQTVGAPPGCSISYEVVLTSPSYHPMVAWPAVCAYNRRSAISFRPGVTKIAITVQTTYLACSQQPASDSGTPPCSNGGQLPPLPAGVYFTELVSSGSFLPLCPPVQVTLISTT